jgi:hypothetical protein
LGDRRADVGLRADRHRAGVEIENVGNDRESRGGEAGMDVVVARDVAPADPVLVIVADRRLDPPGRDRGVDAAADRRVGQHVAAVESALSTCWISR